MTKNLFDILSELTSKSIETSESWNNLTLKGILNDTNDKELFIKLDTVVKSSHINKIINYQIDDEPLEDIDELYENLFLDSKWKININKIVNLDITSNNFFYDKLEFIKWAESLNPFNKENPINKYNNLHIVVNDLREPIIGFNFKITNYSHNTSYEIPQVNLPDFEEIQKYVHILSKEKFEINPKSYLVLIAQYNKYSSPFFKMALKSLSASISSEIIDSNEIILRGVRKLNLEIIEDNHISFNTSFVEELRNTVEWIYEEKIDLRLKLFLERVTLDINYNNKYVNELVLINKTSLEQAKERYSFALFERKDQHQKELRELLKDLKTISDLYSTKTRTVLSNLLRDVLAGFFLIAISMFSKLESIEKIIDKPIVDYIFKSFAIYFILSILYQVLMDWFDICKTESEFNYWKNTSREYLSEDEFNKHKANTLEKRKKGTIIFYLSLLLTYLLIAYLTWNFISIIKNK